jgi:hypothetical protein
MRKKNLQSSPSPDRISTAGFAWPLGEVWKRLARERK